MATVLTTPREVGRRISDYITALQSQVTALNGYDRLMRDELRDGATPMDTKALIDPLMAHVNTSIDHISTNLAALTYKSVIRWSAGSPPGVGWLRTGYFNNTTFLTSGATAMGKQMVLYNDVGPNEDLFYQTTGGSATNAVKVNDVISVENCSHAANNGRYTIKYNTMPKEDNTYYGVAAVSSWTAGGTGWTPATGVYSSSGAAGTLTEALANCSATGAVTVQFTIAYTSGTGTLTATIGGDYYFSKTISSAADSGTYSFTSNASGATPNLVFTATRATGTFEFTLSNPFVYGAPVLFTVEEFDADVGATNDDSTIITLEQTAA